MRFKFKEKEDCKVYLFTQICIYSLNEVCIFVK